MQTNACYIETVLQTSFHDFSRCASEKIKIEFNSTCAKAEHYDAVLEILTSYFNPKKLAQTAGKLFRAKLRDDANAPAASRKLEKYVQQFFEQCDYLAFDLSKDVLVDVLERFILTFSVIGRAQNDQIIRFYTLAFARTISMYYVDAFYLSKNCALCSAPARKHCSQCYTRYCCRDHQAEHWQDHRVACTFAKMLRRNCEYDNEEMKVYQTQFSSVARALSFLNDSKLAEVKRCIRTTVRSCANVDIPASQWVSIVVVNENVSPYVLQDEDMNENIQDKRIFCKAAFSANIKCMKIRAKLA